MDQDKSSRAKVIGFAKYPYILSCSRVSVCFGKISYEVWCNRVKYNRLGNGSFVCFVKGVCEGVHVHALSDIKVAQGSNFWKTVLSSPTIHSPYHILDRNLSQKHPNKCQSGPGGSPRRLYGEKQETDMSNQTPGL
jgi:hypothetical protein